MDGKCEEVRPRDGFDTSFDIEHLYYPVVKRCAMCGETKPLSEFHLNTNEPDGRQVYCKPCRKRYDHEYYAKNRERLYVERIENKRARSAERTEWLRSLKTGPCADCGRTFPPEAMEWDHRPGEKKLGDISNALRSRRKDMILAEIAKCDLVCAVDHAIRTRRRLLENGRGDRVAEAPATYLRHAA